MSKRYAVAVDSIAKLFPQQARPSVYAVLAVAVLALTLVSISPAYADNNWYVSSRATSKTHNGTSWTTAWTDMNQINWSLVQPNDSISIDAGAKGTALYYYHPLVVGQDNVWISVALDTPHNSGIAVLQGSGVSGSTGININNHTGVYLFGFQWLPNATIKSAPDVIVQGYTNGLSVGPQGQVNVSNLWLRKCAYGLNCQGQVNASYLVIDDNTATNVICTSSASSNMQCSLNNSWICNIYGTYTPGVVNNGSASNDSYLGVETCVVGPGLSNGVVLNNPGGLYFNTQDCLYLDPLTTNISIVQWPTPTATTGSIPVGVANNTFFERALNVNGKAHNCLTFAEPATTLIEFENNVFYGGTMAITGNGQVGTISNYLYKTSGNSAAINSTQINPLFTSNVTGVYSEKGVAYATVFQQLCNLNFALQPATPALGFNGSPAGTTWPTTGVYSTFIGSTQYGSLLRRAAVARKP
ncbi:MAG TPA: hypothetical protein V6C69_01815 [Trichormus sp.]|jgi:hypothetical protein